MQIKTSFNIRVVCIAIVLSAPLLSLGSLSFLRHSQLLMPKEYKTVKNIVNKLALQNDLGKEPIVFTINVGSLIDHLAEELNLCTGKKCHFFSYLNPYKPYQGKSSDEINEAIRQSYLFNAIEAYASPMGIVSISRSTFKSFARKDNLFTCVIAHELSHILNYDAFERSLREGKESKGLDKKKREKISKRIARELEVQADNNATRMAVNTGLPNNICVTALDFTYRHEARGEETKENSSHLGYEDRRHSLVGFIEEHLDTSSKAKRESSKGKWQYNRELNTLTFTPS